MHASVLFLLVLSGANMASTADATAESTAASTVDSTADAMEDPAAPAAVLPPRVQAVLDGHDLDRDGLSIVVQSVEEPEPLLSLNPAVPRSPASIIKLLTSFAALDMLGPAYTWKTRAYLGGEVVDGRLSGDLPFARKEMAELLTAEYPDQAAALAAVDTVRERYEATYPEVAARQPDEIEQAGLDPAGPILTDRFAA